MSFSYENFLRERITELRIKKGISEYKMSLDLGHSGSYIKSISSGKSFPSMAEFLYICEYFQITPKDFFDVDMDNPEVINSILQYLPHLTFEDLKAVEAVAKQLNEKNNYLQQTNKVEKG